MAKSTAKKADTGKPGKPGSDAITGEMPIETIVMTYPATAEVFIKHGLHCIGCAAARFENVAEGAMAHGIELDPLLKDLNKVANKK